MEPNIITCAICLELPCYPVITSCGHLFCIKEITHWLKKQNNCPLCRARQDVHDLRSNVPAKKIVAATASNVGSVVSHIIAELQKPIVLSIDEVTGLLEALNIKPLTVHVTVFDLVSESIQRFRLPQAPETGARIAKSLVSNTPIIHDKLELDADSKVDSLIFRHEIELSSLIQSCDLQNMEFVPKVYKKIIGIQFHDGLISLCTDVGSYCYSDEPQARRVLQAAENPQGIFVCLQTAMRYILSQKEHQQIRLTTESELPREAAMVLLRNILETKVGPASYIKTFEFNNITRPNLRCYVGVTDQMPRELPGIPIDLSASFINPNA